MTTVHIKRPDELKAHQYEVNYWKPSGGVHLPYISIVVVLRNLSVSAIFGLVNNCFSVRNRQQYLHVDRKQATAPIRANFPLKLLHY